MPRVPDHLCEHAIVLLKGVMHSLFLRGHELGFDTQQPQQQLCFIFFPFYLKHSQTH